MLPVRDPMPSTVPDKARIELLSPLRLRENNRELKPEHFTFRHFAMSLLRRLSLLCRFHGKGVLEADFKGLRDQAPGQFPLIPLPSPGTPSGDTPLAKAKGYRWGELRGNFS